MKYVKVNWVHDLPTEPVVLYSEIDDGRWEVRKVEIHRDGSCGWAGEGQEVRGTRLGEVPMPALTEIAADPQFKPVTISKADFEQIWANRKGRGREG